MSDLIIAAIINGAFLLAIALAGEKRLDKIHILVNSQMGLQLKLNAANSRWRADSSHKPEDIQAADQAETLLREHETNQAIVDKT